MFAWIATTLTVTLMVVLFIWLVVDAIKAHQDFKRLRLDFIKQDKIGRASCRERVSSPV